MSQVKFEQRETVRTSAPPPAAYARDLPGAREDVAHKIGDALTKGAGPNGYLAVSETQRSVYREKLTVWQWYLKKLQESPLRTKMITSGSLAGLQEFLASWIAKDRNKSGGYFTTRIPKMALYGALISAPLGHVMISILQKMFAGRTSLRAKIFQIIVSNLIVSPTIQLICFLG